MMMNVRAHRANPIRVDSSRQDQPSPVASSDFLSRPKLNLALDLCSRVSCFVCAPTTMVLVAPIRRRDERVRAHRLVWLCKLTLAWRYSSRHWLPIGCRQLPANNARPISPVQVALRFSSQQTWLARSERKSLAVF